MHAVSFPTSNIRSEVVFPNMYFILLVYTTFLFLRGDCETEKNNYQSKIIGNKIAIDLIPQNNYENITSNKYAHVYKKDDILSANSVGLGLPKENA